MQVLCFDIGCTDIKYGIIDNGNIIIKKKTPTEVYKGLENFKNKLINIVNELKVDFNFNYIGISCAGSIDIFDAKIVVAPDNAKFLVDFNFRSFFKETCNIMCFADNDVNCFALAEMNRGSGQKYDYFLMMTVGTGIGGGIIMKKDLWRGPNFNAGEFGRMLLKEGVKYESLAATKALVDKAKETCLDVENGQQVFDLYDSGDIVATKVVKEFYKNLALGIANLVYAFNPQGIIIGGGITNRQSFIEELDCELKAILHHSFYETVEIKCSHFKNDGGMIGAYFLVSTLMEEK